jgi:hypothetical protein
MKKMARFDIFKTRPRSAGTGQGASPVFVLAFSFFRRMI